MQWLSPEATSAFIQEKHRETGLTAAELMTIPMMISLTDLTHKIYELMETNKHSPWLEDWYRKGAVFLEGMPAAALLGPDKPPSHNAYAINFAALMEAADAVCDRTMSEACRLLDSMHSVGLPWFNVTYEDKVIAPANGELYQELNRISIEDMCVLANSLSDEGNELLKELGWLPACRRGDEGRGIMNVREFLGMFFSDQTLLVQPSGQVSQ